MVSPPIDLRGEGHQVILGLPKEDPRHVPRVYGVDLSEILWHKEDIEAEDVSRIEGIGSRIQKMGADILNAGDDEVYAVCVLNGAMPFYVWLLYSSPMASVPVTFKTTKVDSGYDGTEAVRPPKISNPDFSDAQGKRVIIFDDIADTGRAARLLFDKIAKYGPRSIETAFMVNKPSRRMVEIPTSYVGATIDDKFVVGQGLDYEQNYRGLQHIGVLKPEVYMK